MSACKEIVPLLSAHADGELSPGEGELVLRHLPGCDACHGRLAFFAAQGAALRERVVARAAGKDFSRLTDQVMARVANSSSIAAGQRLRTAERLSLWSSEMWGAHRVMMATAGSFALAACLALAVFLQPVLPDDSAQLAELDAAQSQVDEVDFGTHDGAVMRLPDRTPVIWLGEDHAQ